MPFPEHPTRLGLPLPPGATSPWLSPASLPHPTPMAEVVLKNISQQTYHAHLLSCLKPNLKWHMF